MLLLILTKKCVIYVIPGKVVGAERVAIMAALNLSHEVLNTKSGNIDIGDYRRRISAMQNQIDDAIAEQSKLL
jgi:cell division protein ZapA